MSTSLSVNIQNKAAQKMPAPKPLFIGVTGGTASGKTSLCDRIAETFNDKIAFVSLDMFYKGLT
jgi:uridine kinase